MRAPCDGDGPQETEGRDSHEHLAPRREHTHVAQAVIGFGGYEWLRGLGREAPAFQRHNHRFFVERPWIGDRHEDIGLSRHILAEKQYESERGKRPTEPHHAPNPFVFSLAGVPAPQPEEHAQIFLPVRLN